MNQSARYASFSETGLDGNFVTIYFKSFFTHSN